MLRKINKNNINLKEVMIFSDKKNILNNWLDFSIYALNSKKISYVTNFHELKKNKIIVLDTNKFKEIENSKIDLKEYFFIVPLRNCYLDYMRYKTRFKNIKNFNYKFIFSSNYLTNIEFYTNDFKTNFNNKVSIKDVKGLNFREKIKYFYPLIFLLIIILKKFNGLKKYLFKEKLVFCGKTSHEKNFNKILLNKYGFSKFSINKLSFLYEENNQNVKKVGIKKFEKTLNEKKFKKLPIYEKYYLVQCFYRSILFNHLKKFNFFEVEEKPKVDLLKIKNLKNVHQIYLDPLSCNSRINSRYMALKKYYKNRAFDLSIFSNNYNHSNKNFNKRIKSSINFLYKIKEIQDCDINLKSFLKRLKIKLI
tara:strand:- start:4992 stop:6083 length:1092 start_codon:yes stop_codon:yes gene_type:complete